MRSPSCLDDLPPVCPRLPLVKVYTTTLQELSDLDIVCGQRLRKVDMMHLDGLELRYPSILGNTMAHIAQCVMMTLRASRTATHACANERWQLFHAPRQT